MAWSNKYLAPSGVVLAIIDLGIGTGAFSGTWIGGWLFDTHGALAVFYLSLAFALLVFCVIIALQIWAHLCIKVGDIRTAESHNRESASVEPDEDSPLIN